MGFFKRLQGDLTFLRGAWRVIRRTSPIARNPTRIFPLVIDDLAKRHGDKPALISERETLTYRLLAERSCRYARWALAQGLGRGDVVALLMTNRPEYVAIWLGIIRAGGTVALLNTNLAGPSLAFCIDSVAPRHVIVAGEFVDAFSSADPYRKTTPRVWLHGEATSMRFQDRLDRAVEAFDGGSLPAAERPRLTIEDKALFIFTSGTTGLPKAANINHFRLMLASHAFAGVMNTGPNDCMYDSLPMYHTSGGVLAIGATLIGGGKVFIREKFSAREFWDDMVRHGCTLFMYIGELCRYLVNCPPHPLERAHRLRLCCGNGLRPDIWTEFQSRFAVPSILEFYAATEGNVTLFNLEGKPGAVGRIPWFLARRFPTKIVRFDIERQLPLRDALGRCEEAAPGEVGEAVGRIFSDPARPAGRFEGYSNAADNEAKILRNVFAEGDAWFRSGDLMRRDREGYFYFIDRIGDTFRWRGENVSTTEVSEVISAFAGIHEANVYGVEVQGREGRAGMAALVCEPDLSLAELRSYLSARLPEYARPLFLRIRGEIDVTATFKQRKIGLVRDGFDPTPIRDPIYFDDPRVQAYVRMDEALYREIAFGKVRL
ncbi:MAG TPA: long-chain-acyl-CoA synthetase [Xanthobacteraceae bacterium]|nr:long-chain-acyl-CoA synthetase [Xanthobacteraceae bacterium]